MTPSCIDRSLQFSIINFCISLSRHGEIGLGFEPFDDCIEIDFYIASFLVNTRLPNFRGLKHKLNPSMSSEYSPLHQLDYETCHMFSAKHRGHLICAYVAYF